MKLQHQLLGVTAALAVAFGSPAAFAQDPAAADRTAAAAQDSAEKSGNKVEDAWILTKVKSKFVGEDALEGSDINVDVRSGVVILKGTVASEAGRTRAIAIAKGTEGVARVDDRLVIGTAKAQDADDTVGTAGRTAGAKADDAADRAGNTAERAADKTKDATKRAGEKAKDTAGTTGEAVTDGWITTKVKSSFVGVDALEGSDIDVDTNDHVVTLTGTVASEAGRAEAVRIAKAVKGVTSVSDKLTIADKQ
jgi:hyperosmotically inducible protein